MVINIGFNTTRGNLIQNTLLKDSNFSYYSELLLLSYLTMIFYIISSIFLLYFSYKNHFNVILPMIEFVFIIFPPIILILISISSLYFKHRMKKEKVFCISDHKLNAAGKINNIVLNKKGTLTNEGDELYGFLITKLKNNSGENKVEFDEIERSSNILNIIHKEFWKKYSFNPKEKVFNNYGNAVNFNIVFFVECLATCHGIDIFNDKIFGNSMDKKIYESIDWIQNKSNESNNNDGKVITFKFR